MCTQSLPRVKSVTCTLIVVDLTSAIFYQTAAVGWVQREKDSGPVREYNSEGVQDQVLKAHLSNTYKSFRLKNFTFYSLLENKELSTVKEILCSFFDDVRNS